jgi:hypothetical protein
MIALEYCHDSAVVGLGDVICFTASVSSGDERLDLGLFSSPERTAMMLA